MSEMTQMDGASIVTETWRPVTAFPNDYLVSSWGRVSSVEGVVRQRPGFMRRRPPKILSACDDGRGYWQVVLSIDGKDFHARPHRLVAMAFLGPEPFPGAEVNHKDFNTKNNRVDNLEWMTGANNVQHAVDGKRYCPYANPNQRVKLSPEDIETIRSLLAKREAKQVDLAKAYGVDQSMISLIKSGRRW